ncbi:MAG: pyruvate kinase [Candidatus Omnitrophica bacterium]|nr:pyruvate kinase [Candidatus Omnitrophota bacterium]
MTIRYLPRTKIICTLGPASSSERVIRKMMLAGMDMVRLNFSHGCSKEHLTRLALVRTVNKKYRRRVKILGDLEGPRLRVGKLPPQGERNLSPGKIYYLVKKETEEDWFVSVDYNGALADLASAKFVFIDDGLIHLKVLGLDEKGLKVRVIEGGKVKERKGINAPGAKLCFPRISRKDAGDIAFAVKHSFDWLAQSFVRSRDDVEAVKETCGHKIPVIAKIENREGINNLREIIAVADGIMIARGDLGVSVPIEEVPLIQKEIIAFCQEKNKPVITATQMLEHMVEHPLPTRAEVSDIANAVLDGTDYVMLSAETAIGCYPVPAVRMMNRTISFAERWQKQAKRVINQVG